MFPKKLASKISEFSLGDELDPCQCCAHRPKLSDSQRWSIPGLSISKKKKGSKATTELLTGQQRLVVLRTWYVLSSDIPSLGISTMLKMLELDRRAETLFDFFGKTGETLVQDRQFRQHAFWLIQVGLFHLQVQAYTLGYVDHRVLQLRVFSLDYVSFLHLDVYSCGHVGPVSFILICIHVAMWALPPSS